MATGRTSSFSRIAAFVRGIPQRREVSDDRLAWTALPWGAQLYVAAVIIAGGSTLVAFFPTAFPNPPLFVVLVVSTCLTSLWKVNLPIAKASGSTLSVSYAANLMALL